MWVSRKSDSGTQTFFRHFMVEKTPQSLSRQKNYMDAEIFIPQQMQIDGMDTLSFKEKRSR